jgi:hypothetical protein
LVQSLHDFTKSHLLESGICRKVQMT